jgi:hypothetical protein
MTKRGRKSAPFLFSYGRSARGVTIEGSRAKLSIPQVYELKAKLPLPLLRLPRF